MPDVTQILMRLDSGDGAASAELLPLVYDELRRLAAARLSQESSGQTLQATALVHEAYLRLIGDTDDLTWKNRGHFFAAAAEAMRRILIDNARRKGRVRHGGEFNRAELAPEDIGEVDKSHQLLELNDALDRLAQEDPKSAELVKLRYFAGLTLPQVADVLNISPRKADFLWSFARAWLQREVRDN
jgi:RNA polymerase sigma factor (TIGR02999 family)